MGLPKAYEPKEYEANTYRLWEKSGVFKLQEQGSKGYFSQVAPPPNANADLHIGYALTIAIEDIAARYNRMKGKGTLFVPGADHAGFETQSVFERQLAKEGKSRFDFSREELYRQIWDFVAKNRGSFEKQFRSLGASFDWDYFTFTLDDKVIKQAYSTFKKMWDEGLIYRGERLVNFCTFHGTAFADIEVEYKEEKGHLWYLKYPLRDGGGEVIVATTRPETMLGDTAVAVNPKDPRYKKLIGKTVKLPLTNREIPVLADEMVDPQFGTGAVKITPAHDPNDFEVAQRHDLPMITVTSFEGKMTHEVPEPYRNLEVKEARQKVIKDLEVQGFLQKVEDYTHSVGHCYKCGTIIQPLLKEQWFVDMQPLAKPAIAALQDKKINFYPDSKRLQLIRYLEGLHDWNISRQIAWGIPIPAFQNLENPDDWIFDERVDQEEIIVKGKRYRRDPDVFDTWFSSSSWPYVTLDYPDGKAYKKFYPLSLMETGAEILYPWVSRMLMLGLYETNQIPFKTVYIHGHVMAEDGTKMSKSLGNTINLSEVIEKYGSDALRMGIIAGRVPAVNRDYDHRKVEEARNFANKLWNIARYVEDNRGSSPSTSLGVKGEIAPKSSADHWILNRLSISATGIDKALIGFKFSEAYDILYHFVWDDFADWYIEASKVEPNSGVLNHVLESTLKLVHPFAPFITETIWQNLGKKSLLATELWPEIAKADKAKARQFEEIIKIISEARQIAANVGVSKPVLLYKDSEFIEQNKELVKRLARLGGVESVGPLSTTLEVKGIALTSTKDKTWLDIEHSAARSYLNKLNAQMSAQESSIKTLEGRLANKSYVARAPKKLVEETKTQLESERSRLEALSSELKSFEKSLS